MTERDGHTRVRINDTQIKKKKNEYFPLVIMENAVSERKCTNSSRNLRVKTARKTAGRNRRSTYNIIVRAVRKPESHLRGKYNDARGAERVQTVFNV